MYGTLEPPTINRTPQVAPTAKTDCQPRRDASTRLPQVRFFRVPTCDSVTAERSAGGAFVLGVRLTHASSNLAQAGLREGPHESAGPFSCRLLEERAASARSWSRGHVADASRLLTELAAVTTDRSVSEAAQRRLDALARSR